MDWYLSVMKQYANFNGRARRKEYWMYFLVYVVIIIAASVVDSILGIGGLVYGLVVLAHLIPSIAVGVRRLHDIGRSGWWLLVGLVPFIGWIILLYWAVKEGDAQDNDYGANPKAGELVAG